MTTVRGPSAAKHKPAKSAAVGRLEAGASGAAVKELQQLLKSLGLYGKNADGKFGAVTAAAVKAFQRLHGLKTDGWAGPKTLAKIRQLVAAARHPAPAAPASAQVSSAGGKLALGAKGDEVKELQLRLKAQGFYNGEIGGNFGHGTEAAVRAFQKANRMTVDGWAGPQTMGKLRGPSAPPPGPTSSGAAPVETGPVSASSGVQAAIDFGLSHVGAPYVGGGSPFRFGKPGDGRVYQMPTQHPYRSPAGVIGFDCSGLVVAMFRKAGVDLAAQGLASSSAMKARLPPVPKNQLQAGDLLVKDGHVVIYLGNGKVLQAASSGDPDGDGISNGSVRVSDATSFLNDPSYVGRHVPGT